MKLPAETRPIWLDEPSPSFGSLARDISVDVAIIGAGITGLTTAHCLLGMGFSIAILEAAHVGAGVTSHTSAHLTAILDERYKDLASTFGDDAARAAYTSSTEAIAMIEQRATSDIDCDFQRVPGYLCAATPNDELEDEYATLLRLGIRASKADAPFGGRAIRLADQARFHPVAYLRGLARSVAKRGVRIYEQTRVTSIDSNKTHALVTPNGVVHARYVVVATHSPLTFLALQPQLSHEQSYVVAFTTTKNELEDALYWDTADPYHYVRKHGSMIIAGGADHPTGAAKGPDEAFEDLREWIERRFSVDAFRAKWSSQVVSPADGLPFIGPLHQGSTVFYASGYAGNGLTFGTIAGKIIANHIASQPDPFGELYSAARIKPLASAAAVLENVAHSPIHVLARGIQHFVAEELDSVTPGTGKIVRDGLALLAVYRDEQGELTALHPVCSHMGCLVRFNGAEKTWDCPCHGSRFDRDGSVIAGPATTGLEKRSVRK